MLVHSGTVPWIFTGPEGNRHQSRSHDAALHDPRARDCHRPRLRLADRSVLENSALIFTESVYFHSVHHSCTINNIWFLLGLFFARSTRSMGATVS